MTDHANELRRHARKIPHPQGETPGVMLRAADEIERLQRVIASPHSMTRDEVIRMAREAWTLEFIPDSDVSKLERFASLVAAAERDACAQIVERNASACRPHSELHDILRANALAIRARAKEA